MMQYLCCFQICFCRNTGAACHTGPCHRNCFEVWDCFKGESQDCQPRIRRCTQDCRLVLLMPEACRSDRRERRAIVSSHLWMQVLHQLLRSQSVVFQQMIGVPQFPLTLCPSGLYLLDWVSMLLNDCVLEGVSYTYKYVQVNGLKLLF